MIIERILHELRQISTIIHIYMILMFQLLYGAIKTKLIKEIQKVYAHKQLLRLSVICQYMYLKNYD